MMKALKRKTTLKILAASITFLLCYIVISNYYDLIENNRLISQVLSLGFPVLIVFAPYFLIILSDTLGWVICFSRKMSQKFAGKLLIIRIATETLQVSLPGGAVYTELVRPYLLKKYLHLKYSEGISANIIAKINILVSQVIFIILGLLVLTIYFTKNITSNQFLSKPAFYLIAVVFMSLIFFLTYSLYRKNLLLLIIHLFEKINLKVVRKVLDRIRKPVIEINNTISIFSRNHKTKLLLTVVFFFFTWILISFESLVILKVMGIDASIFQMILIESLISIVRIFFFFIPGAFGPQEVGLIILFNVAGLPDSITNAFLFIFLRRSKELVWIIVGYILLMFLGIRLGKLFKEKRVEFAAGR